MSHLVTRLTGWRYVKAEKYDERGRYDSDGNLEESDKNR